MLVTFKQSTRYKKIYQYKHYITSIRYQAILSYTVLLAAMQKGNRICITKEIFIYYVQLCVLIN